jgi:CRP-like cAMP-binding protein
MNLNYIDNTEEGSITAEGAFGADFHKQRAFSVFDGLPMQPVEAVDAELRMVRYSAGDVIVRAGGPADKFLIVVEGEVELIAEEGGQAAVVLGPGRFYGEMAILRDEPRSGTLKARTDATILTMERDEFRQMVAQSLGTTIDFDHLVSQRLRALAHEPSPAA